MYSYGWREFMPDLGRWNGIDQLAESYLSTSPYAYVANNPVSQFDVDGRWMDANGHIDTSGNANPFRDMAQSQMRMTQFMGRNPGEGGAGGQAQGHKPTIFKRIGNFLERLFGKSKKAAVGVLSVGVATFEGLAPPVEFGSTVAEIAGYARLGLWSLPLMLNGDSSHASGYNIPLTGATDIPVTTTADESEPDQMITLYRGISSKAKGSMYFEALQGIAIPNGFRQVATTWGPHNDMEAHAGGDNLSIWTSWSTSKESARDFATGVAMYKNGIPGIIISKQFKVGSVLPNPYNPQEAEWLVPGVVYGAKVEYVLPR
ncbi:RHS repeat-associated core domain-containing protein [Chryseobacterium sp. RU33C]|nr:RHS repeat-associated core domain-containing protein [Chryseobacterium sp. RU33C]